MQANKPNNQQRKFTSPLKHSNRAFLAGSEQNSQVIAPQKTLFILLEHFSMMAFTGAVDALVTANLLSPNPLYEVATTSLDGTPVRSDLGIDISVTAALQAIRPSGVDIIILCGGYRTPLALAPELEHWLRDAARDKKLLGGLWNGSYLLAKAGVMDDYTCTIHPENRALLAETCHRVSLSKRPYVIDRDRVSCAGANSALDMMLGLIRQTLGQELVRGIEEILSCDKIGEMPDKPMATVTDDPTLPDALQMMLELMANNIEEPLSMSDIANYAGLSRRQVERLFARYVDTTPSRYYLELRITRARQLLLQSNESIANIAIACGFVSTTHFSHCFRDYFGYSPTQARQNRNQG